MNFSSLILEFLNKHGSVGIPGFGTFYLKNINAAMDKESGSILPPGKEVAFRTDFEEKENNDFAEFIAEQKNIPLIDAEIEIKKQVNFWNSTLEKEEKVSVRNIGDFFLDDSKIHFTGSRTENLSPDFYGLEEIHLSEIKNSKIAANSDKPYRFSKTVYWIIPLLTGIAAITYLGITQPETIFGKKSFPDGFEKKTVQKIKKDSVKTDSAAAVHPILDSIKADSIKSAAKALTTPAKKWSSKNHTNSQWKKAKKRQNH